MPKPKYIEEAERKKRQRPFITCGMCKHLGKPVHEVKHNGKKATQYKCDVHPKCYNTVFSIRCGDWEARA